MSLQITQETPVNTRVKLSKPCWALNLELGRKGTITEVRENGIVVLWDSIGNAASVTITSFHWLQTDLLSIVPPWEFQNDESLKTLAKVNTLFKKIFLGKE